MKILFVVLFVVPALFLLWAMWKGVRASGHMAWADSAKLPRADRRLVRIVGFGGPLLIVAASLLGILVRPEPSFLASEAVGAGIGGGIWFVAMFCVTIRRAPKSTEGPEVDNTDRPTQLSSESRGP
jgi:hypothetical protein